MHPRRRATENLSSENVTNRDARAFFSRLRDLDRAATAERRHPRGLARGCARGDAPGTAALGARGASAYGRLPRKYTWSPSKNLPRAGTQRRRSRAARFSCPVVAAAGRLRISIGAWITIPPTAPPTQPRPGGSRSRRRVAHTKAAADARTISSLISSDKRSRHHEQPDR